MYRHTPSSDNPIKDVFVYDTAPTSPVMLRTFDAATGCWINLTTGITVGDLLNSYLNKTAKTNNKQQDNNQK
jgi:hypothetical protein